MTTCFAFDLDGTITSEEILPIIAAELSLEEEMRTLTDLTLNGHIDFAQSFRLRCAILGAVPISVVRSVVETVRLNEAIVEFICAHRDSSAIVTGNLDVWIDPLVERLDCRTFSSTALSSGDTLTGVAQILIKSDAVTDLRRDFHRIVSIGDSFNDVSMFERSDVRIAFGGTHTPAAPLTSISDYVAYHEDSLCRLLNTLL